jgi:transposase
VLVLYDVTSSYLEGRRCELAQFGFSRDHRGDRPQIVFGLLCTPQGCPVAVEVFEGNLGDPTTLAHQVKKAAHALSAEAHRAGRRPRHDHQGAHRRRP